MKRLILFNEPNDLVMPGIKRLLFPDELENKKVAYMPSDGSVNKHEYTDMWEKICQEHSADFHYINNSKEGSEAENEIEKMLDCNILIITGGNTFTLLRNLRRSGMFEAIKEFAEKKEFVIAGFSAGAIVLTPCICTSGIKGADVNGVGIKDLSALGLVDFEFFAHYGSEWKEAADEYEKDCSHELRRVGNNEYIVVEL